MEGVFFFTFLEKIETFILNLPWLSSVHKISVLIKFGSCKVKCFWLSFSLAKEGLELGSKLGKEKSWIPSNEVQGQSGKVDFLSNKLCNHVHYVFVS